MRTANWLKAREEKVVEGKPMYKPETAEVAAKIQQLQSSGHFVPSREKDALSVAIGTMEHGGHVRGVSSKLNWMQGFLEDAHMYKKHDRYKQTMRETAEEVFAEKIKDLIQARFVKSVQTGDEQQVLDILQSSRPLAPPVI